MNAGKVPQPLENAPLVSDWISLGPKGKVTVKTGRVELGQGGVFAVRQMAANELDCAPEKLTMISGHTGVTPNEGFTAGSMTVSMGGMAVRWAASALRVLVLQEVRNRVGCSPADLSLKDGQIVRNGQPTGFDLSVIAADLNLAQLVVEYAAPLPFRARHQGEQDGQRLDLKERLVGAPFLHDLELPGMLYGKPIHPPTMTARLEACDEGALKARPGVVAVVRDGSFVGVVAETEVDAINAARWFKQRAKWVEEAHAPNNAIQAIATSSEPAEIVFQVGDTDTAECHRFETTISRPFLFHGSIGPSAAVAEWSDDGLAIWSHSQGVYQLRSALAMALDMPEDRISIRHHIGSGCYGHNGADDAALDAALMARAVPGRPIRVVWSRADEFQCAPMGPAMVTRCSATVDDSGRITAMDVAVNSAPHGNRPGVGGNANLRAAAYLENPFHTKPSKGLPFARGGDADRNAMPIYAIPNVAVQKRLVHDLPYRTSSLRGLGAYANIYAIETLMDEIAADIGVDPVAFRMGHLKDDRAREVIEAVDTSAPDWRKELAGQGVGWGIGFARYKNIAGYCAVLARVEIDQEVRVTQVHATADIGEIISRDGALNQIEGGIIQSLSWTLKEAVRLEGTQVAAENWLDYSILRFSEIPDVTVALLDRRDEPPLGCGEIAQGPAAAAVGNAVRAALGVTVRDLPLTRDRILKALL